MTTEKQPELFGEFKNLKSKDQLFGKGIFPEKSFTFTFSRDKFILLGVGFIILLAIVFALGFEQGKRKISSAPKANKVIRAAAHVPEAKKPAVQPELKPYIIQVATFKSSELAQKEISKLKKMGFSATIAAVNGFHQVQIGAFRDYKEATQTLNTLKKIYKDCYIKKR